MQPNPGRGAPDTELRAFIEALITSWIVSQRELHGVRDCEIVMGAWRRTIGTALPPNALGMTASVQGKGSAAAFLRDICHACGGCELGREREPPE